MTRISIASYENLREALSVVTWYKKSFERLVKGLLRGHPELLAQLSFSETKRETANVVVDILMNDERRYSALTLEIMGELAAMEIFPDFDRLEKKDRLEKQRDAAQAVANLKTSLEKESSARDEVATTRRKIDEYREKSQRQASFKASLGNLKKTYLALTQQQENLQERGRALEKLLNDLFALFDLEPRLAYSSNVDQVDGSFRLDTDDYLIEAKWTQKPLGRDQADIFVQKITRRGKLAVGLLVSINGFSEPLREAYATSSSFITMDGSDLFLVLDDRWPLDEALLAKKRHVNETGSCHMPLT